MMNLFNNQNDATNTTDQVNALLKMASDKIACGPDCQKKKETSQLYKEYLDAQTYYLNAPEKLKIAEKNYYVKSYGVAAYNDFNKKQLASTADEVAETLSSNFHQQLSDAYSLNNMYNTDWINAQNTIELYEYYLSENKKLVRNVTNASSDVYTNDRRSYYENEELEDLQWWYTIEIWIYILVVVVFIVFSIFGISTRSRKVLFISIACMILYPFVSLYMALYIFSFIKWFFSLFPKNVYL